ncbi:MAG: hypothetical protein KatS3mg020_0893 [Fimbriimonadales bacterium]|nr:MAG: hypothetical protein KatS3mg020_0893 [Fimbriimonadales bacterium]
MWSKRLFKNHSSQNTASTAVSLPAKSKPPPPHRTHPNTETNDQQRNNHAKRRSTHQRRGNNTKPPHPKRPTQSKPTSHLPNNHTSNPSQSYALSAITTDTERYRPNTPSKTPYAPRASDTSAPVTITPNKFPCESTTICRLRPLIFLPPSYPRTPLFGWSAHSDCPPLPSWAVRVAPADTNLPPARVVPVQTLPTLANDESGNRRFATGAGRGAGCVSGCCLEHREHRTIQVVEAVSAGCADAFAFVEGAFEGGFDDRLLWGVGSDG